MAFSNNRNRSILRILPIIFIIIYSFFYISNLQHSFPKSSVTTTQHHDKQLPAPPAAIVSQLTNGNNHNSSSLYIVTTAPSYNDEDCICDLISVDCLESLRCLSSVGGNDMAITLGIITRQAIKLESSWQEPYPYFIRNPLGKLLQYLNINNWKMWMHSDRRLPKRYLSMNYIFVNDTQYSYCDKHELSGMACFFQSFNETEDLYELEIAAVNNTKHLFVPELMSTLRREVVYFHQSLPSSRSNFGSLLSFAHTQRIQFNLHSHMKHEYIKRLTSIKPKPSSSSSSSNGKDQSIFRIALHMRRADACDHKKNGYERTASPLDSPAQVSGKRLCYHTMVYVRAMQRAISTVNLERKRQKQSNVTVHVYLSTDHHESVMKDFQHLMGLEAFERLTWHYLNYSSIFQYEAMIDSDHESVISRRGVLGESAALDLFHLSHGEVFIGHLGSRFGKVSYLLSTARYNSFIPFFSVDGHSFCCEVDEACGDMKKYIVDMENCMTFVHDQAGGKVNEDYWEVGSTVRQREFMKKQKV